MLQGLNCHWPLFRRLPRHQLVALILRFQHQVLPLRLSELLVAGELREAADAAGDREATVEPCDERRQSCRRVKLLMNSVHDMVSVPPPSVLPLV